jgi:hypothetical protein
VGVEVYLLTLDLHEFILGIKDQVVNLVLFVKFGGEDYDGEVGGGDEYVNGVGGYINKILFFFGSYAPSLYTYITSHLIDVKATRFLIHQYKMG